MMNEMNTTPMVEEETVTEMSEGAEMREKVFLFVVTAVIILLDQFSKFIVEATMPINSSYAPIPALEPIFKLTHVTNTGAAFGLFQGGGNLFTIVAVVVTIVILYHNYTLPAGQTAVRLALGLQLAGALGNVIDRYRLGHVTDFLDFGPWPVFNVADTSIVAGVVILIWLMFKEEREKKAAEAQQVTADTAQPE
jgi:signal peptidase II